MLYLQDARLHRAVFLLLGALSIIWMAGQVLPAQAGPGDPGQPHGDQAEAVQVGDAWAQKKTIYWGALISGSTYGRGNPPWDEGTIDQFEQNAGKPASILHWGQSWWRCQASCDYQEFSSQRQQSDAMRRRGIIPLVDWSAWDSSASRVAARRERACFCRR